MASSLSSVPPVWPRPRPEIIGTAAPQAARIGARIRLTLSPTPVSVGTAGQPAGANSTADTLVLHPTFSIEETVEFAREKGYVETLLGRRRPIPELRSGRPQVRSQGERLAVNMPIQGTSADIIKIAMVGAHRALAESDLETRLVLQIHDELLFEGPADEMDAASELVEREMTQAFELDPPLAVDVGAGKDWLAAK